MSGATVHTQRLLMRPISPFRFRTSHSSASSLRAYSAQPPKGPNNAVKFWPFIAIIGIGFASYAYMAKARAAAKTAPMKKL
ncbi:uncharacterized protein GGS22DRAFT_149324 [Annulohypoxylon maeteangense]|uniref:uncharacterized protein n=1 Tax=Annulohypoxylon maeteangense TaxID=1927788 RepID=UPI002008AEE6|nr:uncharacterized protein GGS22DRAFT_149324 [Annulohypoxylon maeteangense]KAI0889863.1 hypothetical protein GGS22DRAFT_149324 [Annulohypoxylon maeteangense]